MISLTDEKLPDIKGIEEVLKNAVCGIEPIEVQAFPASWQKWVKDELGSCDGAVLLALRNIKNLTVSESSGGWAFSADFVCIFKEYSGEVGSHKGGYDMIKSVIDSLNEKIFFFGESAVQGSNVQYTTRAQESQFITQLDERFIWVVRVDVRPTLTIR